jgi:hypothetical protein
VSRRRIALFVVAVALAVGGFAWAQGRAGDKGPERVASDKALANAAALGSSAAEAELERRSQALQDAEEHSAKGPAAGLSRRERRIDSIDDLGWRAFDRQFRETPFDRAIDHLPLRKPPLHVLQWVTDSPADKLQTEAQRERFYRMSQRAQDAAVAGFYRSGTHRLYARVDRDGFFGMSLRAREAAVQAFYRDARPWFEKAGVKDFVLVVTPWTETTEHLPAYAVGRGNSATLTPLGRGERPGV